MNNFLILKNKINNRTAKITIVGLGYVGLPLAVNFAKKGYFVFGFDTDQSRIEKLKKGEKFIVDVEPKDILRLIKNGKFYPTAKEDVLDRADIIIICVPTPLKKVMLPDISYVVKAARTIKKYLKGGHLIILESTSYTTTTRTVVLPILKSSGLNEESDFYLCFSPERVNPADKSFPVTKIPKAVGGLSLQSTDLAYLLYSQIIEKVFKVSSPEIAETSKLLENTFRLVNIALINEFAIFCHKLGISVWEVIDCARTKPFGFMPFYPGPGIGGHCIPCDPVFLSWKAKKMGFKTKMIDLAVEANYYMPKYVVERLNEIFSSLQQTRFHPKRKENLIKGMDVLVLGVAYKKDVKDLRESPALEIIEELIKRKAKVSYFDPFFPYLKIKDIDLKAIELDKAVLLGKFDCIVLVTDHTGVDYEFIRCHAKLIFDCRNVYKGTFDNIVKL